MYLNVQAYVSCAFSLKIVYIHRSHLRIWTNLSESTRWLSSVIAQVQWVTERERETEQAGAHEWEKRVRWKIHPLCSPGPANVRERMIVRYMRERKRDRKYILVSREIHPPIWLTHESSRTGRSPDCSMREIEIRSLSLSLVQKTPGSRPEIVVCHRVTKSRYVVCL